MADHLFARQRATILVQRVLVGVGPQVDASTAVIDDRLELVQDHAEQRSELQGGADRPRDLQQRGELGFVLPRLHVQPHIFDRRCYLLTESHGQPGLLLGVIAWRRVEQVQRP